MPPARSTPSTTRTAGSTERRATPSSTTTASDGRSAPLDGAADGWAEPEGGGSEPNDATRALARCLQPLVEQLPAIYRDALSRVDLRGNTHQQAAAALGISVSGMKSRVQRGRHQLRDLLTACCDVHTDSTGAIRSYQPDDRRCACNCR